MMRAQEGLPKPWKRPLRAHRPAKWEHRESDKPVPLKGQVKPRGNRSGRHTRTLASNEATFSPKSSLTRSKTKRWVWDSNNTLPSQPTLFGPKKNRVHSPILVPKKDVLNLRCKAPARISTSLVAPSPGARDASTLQPAVSRRPTTRHREGERSAVSTLERIWGVGTCWDHGSRGSTSPAVLSFGGRM